MVNKRIEENRCNHAYIVYYADIPIGFISITNKDESYQISYGIRLKSREEHLGTLLLQEFSEKMYEIYPKIDKLTLVISDVNERSQDAVTLAGYTQENNTRYTQRRI